MRVQRDRDAREHRQDAADEHGEKVVDARAASPKPVQSLNLERERHEQRDDRQAEQVLRERRLGLRDRHELDEPAVEADEVRQQERGRRRQQVGDHVAGDEQAVVASQHAARAPPARRRRRRERLLEPRRTRTASACARIAAGSKARSSNERHRVGECVRRLFGDQHARDAGHDGFEGAAAAERNHRPAARHGLDRDDAEVLFAGQEHGPRAAVQVAERVAVDGAEKLDGGARAGAQARHVGTGADHVKRDAEPGGGVDRDVEPFVGHQRRYHQKSKTTGGAPSGVKNAVSTGGCRTVDSRL